MQRPHRHNSVALDLAVAAKPGVYTLMGKEIDDKGEIIDPIRCDWIPGGVFVTPPGWWHSHHNESEEVAWVLPMQDAGLYTHQRTPPSDSWMTSWSCTWPARSGAARSP